MRACRYASVLLLLPLAALAADPRPTLHMTAEGEVQIAPDGHVSDYRLTSTLAPALAQMVDKHVREWQFVPVLVDGHAVVAKTHMALNLSAQPSASADDKYNVRVDNVNFGAPRRLAGGHAPHYPEDAQHAGIGARVLLALKIDEKGEVADVQVYQTSLDVRTHSENEAERWRHSFEHQSLIAARHWHFDLSESVNGHPIGTNAIVPIVYSLKGVGADHQVREGHWKAYEAGPLHPAPWMNPALAGTSDLTELEDGESRSLDSRFKLKDDVVGSLL